MGPEVVNRIKDSEFHGNYAGRDLNVTNIIMLEDSEREFVVTHNANIKPVAYFTGREKELEDLRQRIEEGRKSVLVSGMGGIGKTHICRKLFEEYLKKHAKDENVPFQYLGFIAYDGDMGSSLQNCLKFKEQDNPEQNQEAAWRELEYLAADGKLLLFVDNVDKTISADLSLQRLKGIPGAIVLTSRQASICDEFEPYPIRFLDMEQCKEIYEKIRFRGSGRKVNLEEDPDLEYVIETLAGRHTITVEHLAHLAWTKHWPVKRLRKELEEKGFCLEFHKDGGLVNIQKSYEVLYGLSTLTRAEENILEAFSVFPYIPLAAEICNEWLLEDARVSEDDDILMGLYRKGWLQFDGRQESYSMHPVFAQFIFKECRPKFEEHRRLIGQVQKSLEIPQSGFALKCREYIPFVEGIIGKVCVGESEEQIEIINWIGYLMLSLTEYEKAERLIEKCFKLCTERGEEDSDIAAIYTNLARVYIKQSKYNKAEDYLKKSLKISKKEDLYTAERYDYLADVYKVQGKYKESEELYKKGIQIREKLGEEYLSISFINLVELYLKQKKYSEAEELCKKSLQIHEKKLGKDNLDMAKMYDFLAKIYNERKKYEKAEELNRKVLQIIEKKFGKESLTVGIQYINWAEMYIEQEKYGEAEELCKKSLQIHEKKLGEKHLDTAKCYVQLANVYAGSGEYKKAEELYKQSLQIYKKQLGEEHIDVANIYNSLAIIYARREEYRKAEESCKKSLQITTYVLGKENFEITVDYINLAYVYRHQGKYGEAKELYEKCIQMREKILGKNHLDTVAIYDSLAKMYVECKKYGEAEKLFIKALQTREKMVGGVHSLISESYNNLAATYWYKSEYEMALSYYLKGYKIIISLGIANTCKQIIKKNMKLAYNTWEPDGDFEQWLEEKMTEEG